MNKQDLLDKLVKITGQPRSAVTELVDLALDLIVEKVAKGEDVTISGFGTFIKAKRKASKGFNPHTGKAINLPEIPVIKFRAGKGFKEKLKR